MSLALLVVATAACGSSSKDATITITAPEKDKELTLANDDLDPMKDGLQYNVTATSSHVAAGTMVVLGIEGDSESARFAKVGSDGSISFEKVTLPPGKHAIKVSTATGNVHSADDWDYTFKALVIERPRDNSALSLADDKDLNQDGIQINVSVTTYAVEASENVSLQVDGKTVGSPVHPENNKLVFSNITLASGDHKLKAIAGSAESNLVNVSVNPDCASVTFVTPEPPAEGTKLTLGGGDKCPKDGGPFMTDITISTDAGDNKDVELQVNDVSVATAKVKGSVAKFTDVVLDRRETANKVAVIVQGTSGVTCKPVLYPVDLFVNCMGADCSIASPKPMTGSDASGNRVFYVNKSQKGTDGFDFSVQTSPTAMGKPIKLIIDGNDIDAPSADPMGSGDTLTAKFNGVDLSDGKHTLQARCVDMAGNISLSNKANWVVDTEACVVDITDPGADALIVASQDTDKNKAGVQIAVKSNVKGDDCSQTRAAPCVAKDGIKSGDYSDFDGSPLTSTVTLSTDADQTLCVEVLDRAGNVGRDSVAVKFKSSPAKLLIESPKDGDKFNAEGNDGYKADSDRASADVCQANFDVACTEIGKQVKLHRGDAKGTVFAMANCAAKANGAAALPAGFAGRAHFTNATFLPNNADNVTVVATQDMGSNDVVGESDPIKLTGDCQLPALMFSGGDPCSGGQLAVADANSTVTKDIVAGDSTTDTKSAHLAVTSGGSDVVTKDANISNGTYTFSAIALGGPGSGSRSIKIEVSAKDDYANTGKVSCDANIVYDLPVLMVTAPTDNLVLKPGDPMLCTPTGGGNGVPVAATADKGTDRSAAVKVNAASDVALTLTGTAISGCAPLSDGSNTLAIKLTSTKTTAVATVNRTVVYVPHAPTANGIMITTANSPSDRNGKVTLGWTAPQDEFTGQYVGYQLRCDATPLDLAATTDPDRQKAWWDGARVVTLPAGLKASDQSVQLDFRVGETNYCVIRAADAAGGLTPLANSSGVVSVPFRTAHFTPATANQQSAGWDFAGVGDVNDDGIDDMLVGGMGEASLVFGSTNGWSSSTPNVTFIGDTQSYFGYQVASIGDFNGDGKNDFAISDYSWPNPTYNGRVFVFFGRRQNTDTAWPSSIDLRGSCAADLCFENNAAHYFGAALEGIGDFNNDGRPDLAVGASNYPMDTLANGRLIIILGKNYEGASKGGPDFYQTTVTVPNGAALQGFVMDGDVNGALFGTSITSLGSFDSTAGTDLAVSGPGSTGVMGRVFFLSGHTYDLNTQTGLQTLTMGADLGFRDGGGTPRGMPIDQGPNNFAQNIVAPGNVYNLASANKPNTVDLAVWQGQENGFYVYLGDTNFASADRITVGPAMGNAVILGQSICNGRAAGDLDGDGLVELCAAGEQNPNTGAAGGVAALWYSDIFANKVSGKSINTSSASLLNPAGFSMGPTRVVEYVGDLNKDGKPDMVIGAMDLNAAIQGTAITGEFTILY